MIELKQKRTYTAKHFDKGNGKFVMHAHTGHIHYFNKLGVGDGEKRFREIDWTLQWDEKRRGWYFQFHNFHPFLPEYSDGWVEFRDLYEDKDQTIRYKAICNRVKGRLVKAEELEKEGLKDLTGVNCIIYDDAFGKGFDYILYFTRSALVKAVRIRDGYKPKSDVNFEWQVDFPKDPKTLSPLPIFRTERKEDLTDELKTIKKTIIKEGEKTKAYLLNYTSLKEFDTRKQTLIGQDRLDGKEWFTYFRPFRVWDSNKDESLQEIVKTEIYPKDGKFFLRKTITADFLAKSVGDVFTDTTTSYYSGAGDGKVNRYRPNGESWSLIRESDGTTVNYEATYGGAFQRLQSSDSSSAPWRNLFRTSFPFDTSGLPDDATITAATLKIYGGSTPTNGANLSITDRKLYLCSHNRASYTILETSDYDYTLWGTTSWGEIDPHDGTWNTAGYNDISLNSTGISNINKTGWTVLGVRTGADIFDNEPAYPGAYLQTTAGTVYYSEQTGTDKDPYLEITYTEGGATYTQDCSEAIALVDTKTFFIQTFYNEVAALVDNIGRGFFRVYSEAVSLVDSINIVNILAKVLTESINLVDTLTRKIYKVLTDNPVLNAVLATTKTIYRTFSEAITLVATFASTNILAKVLTESITLTSKFLTRLNGWLSNLWSKVSRDDGEWTKEDHD